MKRREFMKSALAVGALYTGGGLPVLGRATYANGFPAMGNRVLVNIMLSGGPDFRHLFTPPFDPNPASYGYRYWEARAASHSIAESSSAYEDRWNNDYFHVSGGSDFGILDKCGWLKRVWDSGHVAIIANSVGGTTRNHTHCEMVMSQGNIALGPNDDRGSGWGGRLASYSGGNALALTRSPDPFTYGPDATDPNKYDNRNLISLRNTRNAGLYRFPAGEYRYSHKANITRSLASYYAALKDSASFGSPYLRFVEHERMLRDFGEPIEARLGMIPVPDEIDALMNGGLQDAYLGEQIRNLYDSFACSDILLQYVSSLNFGGWDTHRLQRDVIEPKLEDLFGDGKALDVLHQVLPDDVLNNTVFVIGGEFGRQLRANGDNGTDHGRGTYILIIGRGVQGGVYGEMFPASELDRLDETSSDITGLTTIDTIYSQVCNWVQPGSGRFVFPDRMLSTIEPGLGLGTLFV